MVALNIHYNPLAIMSTTIIAGEYLNPLLAVISHQISQLTSHPGWQPFPIDSFIK